MIRTTIITTRHIHAATAPATAPTSELDEDLLNAVTRGQITLTRATILQAKRHPAEPREAK